MDRRGPCATGWDMGRKEGVKRGKMAQDWCPWKGARGEEWLLYSGGGGSLAAVGGLAVTEGNSLGIGREWGYWSVGGRMERGQWSMPQPCTP